MIMISFLKAIWNPCIQADHTVSQVHVHPSVYRFRRARFHDQLIVISSVGYL